MENKKAYRKLIIVGDGGCGKTCLLTVFCKGVFPKEYIPTVFESYVKPVQVEDTQVELALWDTAGQKDYDHLRPLSYPHSDVVLVSFDLSNVLSLENVEQKWREEVHQYSSGVPIILVGCKKDLLEPNDLKATSKKIKHIQKDLCAAAYVECSALTGESVQQVFEVAARHALRYECTPKNKKIKRCIVL